jgi:prepilin-type N-terminal cleavage/methylation domain-containing protein
MSKKIFQRQKNKSRGFTLTELLVTLSIVTVISGMVIANYPSFNSRTSLTGLAQQIAISVREAQVYGVSVRTATSSVVGGGTYPAYGVFFGRDTIATTHASDKSYSLFYDQAGVATGKFGISIGDEVPTSNTEILQRFDIGNGNKITKICAKTSSLPSTCTEAAAAFVVFRRPNPDAKIKILPAGSYVWSNGFASGAAYQSAGELRVTIVSRDGAYKKDIVVYSSGQITIAESI